MATLTAVSQIATGARQLAPMCVDQRAYRKAQLIVLAQVVMGAAA
mgnify:CR=1 FL=1